MDLGLPAEPRITTSTRHGVKLGGIALRLRQSVRRDAAPCPGTLAYRSARTLRVLRGCFLRTPPRNQRCPLAANARPMPTTQPNPTRPVGFVSVVPAGLDAAHAVVRCAHNWDEDITKALEGAVEHRGPVWVREGSVDWAWLAL